MTRARRGPWPFPLLLVLAGCLETGCLVSPLEEEGTLSVSTRLPCAAASQRSALSFNPWDASGIFQLELFPKLVRASVETQDFELTTGTWPSPELGIGTGEGPEGEVSISLKVPAGTGRRLRALGFLVEGSAVSLYTEEAEVQLELVAGQTRELALPLKRMPTGKGVLSVRCEAGNMGPWVPVQAALVDARALVLYPSVPLVEDPVAGTIKADLGSVAIGRYYWIRTYLVNRAADMGKYLDKRLETFSIQSESETALVNTVLACD